MDFGELLFAWIVPVGVFSGALVLAGMRWGLLAFGLGAFILDAGATDRLLLDTAWADDRIVADPSSGLVLVLAVVAGVEILASLWPALDRIAGWLRIPAAAALGIAVGAVGTWTAVVVGLAAAILGYAGAQTSRRILDGAQRAGGHPAFLSVGLSLAVAALAALTLAVPLAGFLVLGLVARMWFRLRMREDERHSGLRILA